MHLYCVKILCTEISTGSNVCYGQQTVYLNPYVAIEHLLRYMRPELTSPIASTEREHITLTRQAWFDDISGLVT